MINTVINFQHQQILFLQVLLRLKITHLVKQGSKIILYIGHLQVSRTYFMIYGI
jgi:hypothetical protein